MKIMRTIKMILFTISMIVSGQAFAMEAPPAAVDQISAFPADVWRYTIPFVAECNAYKVAETLRCLNAANKFFHECMQSEEMMLKILDRMPYTANAITLFYKLQSFPIMKKDTLNYDWRYAAAAHNRIGAGALITAAWDGNRERISELLSLKNIDLDYLSAFGSPLSITISKNNKELFEMLLQAGADVNSQDACGGKTPLIVAVEGANIEMVQKLLEAGADPTRLSMGGTAVDCARLFCTNWSKQPNTQEKVRCYKTIITLLDNAVQQKKEKLKRYQNKTIQNCAIS